MGLEAALYQYLTSHEAVSALLRDRLYVEAAPTDRGEEFPYVTYSQTGDAPVWHLGGVAGLTNTRISLDIWARDPLERLRVKDVLKVALDAWAPDAREGVAIRLCQVTDQIDTYVPPTDGSERGVYARTLDLSVWARDL